MSELTRIIFDTLGLAGVAWLYFAIVRPINAAVDRHLERVHLDEQERRRIKHHGR